MATLPVNELLSTIAGYTSIFCWIVVFIPQFYTNYRLKSGASISLHFILAWLVGDILGFIGAVMQGLLPTVIFLAVWYLISDVVLITQILYYDRFWRRYSDDIVSIDATTPLLREELPRKRNERKWLNNIVAVMLVFGVIGGTAAAMFYCVSMVNRREREPTDEKSLSVVPQILGWISAFVYLSARIPQIIKNYQYRSCSGLSLSMFCFCVLGNFTFCLSVLLHSIDPAYLLINAPWLTGSGGTLAFDFMIMYQFYLYRGNEHAAHKNDIGNENSSSMHQSDINPS